MFAQIITDLRKNRTKLTQTDLAKLLGVAKTTYASYEQGKRTPDIEIQKKIADYYNVSLDYLHGFTTNENKSQTNEKNSKALTVAAHIDEDTSDEEMEEILDYIAYIKSKHKKN